MTEQLIVDIVDNPRKKRKPSAYNRHVAREMKAGKTLKQAARSWKKSGKTTGRKKVKRTSGVSTSRKRVQNTSGKLAKRSRSLSKTRPRDSKGRFLKGRTGAAGWHSIDPIRYPGRGKLPRGAKVFKVAGVEISKGEAIDALKTVAGAAVTTKLLPFLDTQLAAMNLDVMPGNTAPLGIIVLAVLIGVNNRKFKYFALGAIGAATYRLVQNLDLSMIGTSGNAGMYRGRMTPGRGRMRRMAYNFPLPDSAKAIGF